MGVYVPPGALVAGIMGKQVHRAAATIAADQDLFSASGAVLLTGFLGRVTVAIGGGSQDFGVYFDPDDGGSNVDLADTSTPLIADADVVGTLYTLNPTAAGDLVAATDVAYGAKLAVPIALSQAGDIVLDVTGTEAGSVEWWAWYLPLDDGAELTAS